MTQPDPNRAVTSVSLGELPVWRSGKVREVFDCGAELLIVATDRLSAFDVVLAQGIPGKGRVLTALSALWFELLADVVPNHMLSVEVAKFPAAVARFASLLEGRAMLCTKTEPLPIECVVRGYLVGSGWKDYRETGTVCGIPLPAGLVNADRLERPIFTPASKESSGHDVNISVDEVARRLGSARARELERTSLALYQRAAAYALERGIIIADTKFEFGLVGDRLMLIDEVFTPDSSRFWPADAWKPGANPPSFDKQFARDWLEQSGWDKSSRPPDLPAEVIAGTARRYREILEILSRR